MPRDAVSRTANVERNGGHKWVNAERRQPLRRAPCVVFPCPAVIYKSLIIKFDPDPNRRPFEKLGSFSRS